MSDEKIIWEKTNASGWRLIALPIAGTRFSMIARIDSANSYGWTLSVGEAAELGATAIAWTQSVEPEHVDAATDEQWGQQLYKTEQPGVRAITWKTLSQPTQTHYARWAKRLRVAWGIDILEDALGRWSKHRETTAAELASAVSKVDSLTDELAAERKNAMEWEGIASELRRRLTEAAQKLAEAEQRREQERKDAAFLIGTLREQLTDTEEMLDLERKEHLQAKDAARSSSRAVEELCLDKQRMRSELAERPAQIVNLQEALGGANVRIREMATELGQAKAELVAAQSNYERRRNQVFAAREALGVPAHKAYFRGASGTCNNCAGTRQDHEPDGECQVPF